MSGNAFGGIYYLDSFLASGNNLQSIKTTQCYVSMLTWHNMLCHPTDQSRNVLKESLRIGYETFIPCDVCNKAKQSHNSIQVSEHKTTKLGALIHLDVCGPYRVATLDGFKFFLNIMDDFT